MTLVFLFLLLAGVSLLFLPTNAQLPPRREEDHHQEEPACDELKCRSPGFYGGYDCWAALGPNSTDPFLCEDGYEGMALSSIPNFTLSTGPSHAATYQYFTCYALSSVWSSLNTIKDANDETSSPSSSLALDERGRPPAVLHPSFEPCGDIGGDCFADGPYEPME
jgi:hypothetical protein